MAPRGTAGGRRCLRPRPSQHPTPVRSPLALTARASRPAQQWVTAVFGSATSALPVAVPTDLLGTPLFGREVPPTAFGYSGAMRWFAALQPLLQVAGIAVLAWALIARLRSSLASPRPLARADL